MPAPELDPPPPDPPPPFGFVDPVTVCGVVGPVAFVPPEDGRKPESKQVTQWFHRISRLYR